MSVVALVTCDGKCVRFFHKRPIFNRRFGPQINQLAIRRFQHDLFVALLSRHRIGWTTLFENNLIFVCNCPPHAKSTTANVILSTTCESFSRKNLETSTIQLNDIYAIIQNVIFNYSSVLTR